MRLCCASRQGKLIYHNLFQAAFLDLILGMPPVFNAGCFSHFLPQAYIAHIPPTFPNKETPAFIDKIRLYHIKECENSFKIKF